MTFELKPFRIGPIEIDFPVVLAPLAGYSDLAFRRICRRLGAGYCTTEMMLDRTVTARSRRQLPLLAIDEDDHPVAGQLIGNDPGQIAMAAENLEGRGFDAIDLNFACPVNKALKRRRGGYLMKQPDLAVEIVRSVTAAVNLPVTVKVRQSFEEGGDEGPFRKIAAGAGEAGAAAIILHGRSVEQKYRGRADWDFIRRVKADFPDWTVVGTGDLLKPRDAIEMLEQTGADAVGAARGALGNPWFFSQVRDCAAGKQPQIPAIAEQRRVLEKHFEGALELYGPKRAPRIMRKSAIKYARMHPESKRVRMAFVECMSPARWHGILDEYYS